MSNTALVEIGILPAPAPTGAAATLAVTPWPKYHVDLGNTADGDAVRPLIPGLLYKTAAPGGGLTVIDTDGGVVQSSMFGLSKYVGGTGASVWTLAPTGADFGSAAVDPAGKIYVSSALGQIMAVSSASGSLVWPLGRFATHAVDMSSPTIAGGQILVGSDEAVPYMSSDGRFYALYGDGTLHWETLLDGPVRSCAAVKADVTGAMVSDIVVNTMTGKVYDLDPTDGHVKAEFAAPLGFLSSPVFGT